MKIPNTPTDNLYKFMAVSGLLISMLSILVNEYMNNQLNLQLAKTEAALSVTEMNLTRLKKQTQNKESNFTDFESAEFGDFLDQYSEAKKSHESQGVIINQLKRLGTLYYTTVPGGILLSFLGFILWYYKLQRYQDIIVKNQANKPS